MRLRALGKRPIQVAKLFLCARVFSDQSDLAVARRITDHAHEQGVNFIDTANVHSTGSSEVTVGELLKGTRQDRVPARKVGNKVSERPNKSLLARLAAARPRCQLAAAGHRPHRHPLP
jgi:aryl-alcohol dehydrogenase-like predicted oxidoreductase